MAETTVEVGIATEAAEIIATVVEEGVTATGEGDTIEEEVETATQEATTGVPGPIVTAEVEEDTIGRAARVTTGVGAVEATIGGVGAVEETGAVEATVMEDTVTVVEATATEGVRTMTGGVMATGVRHTGEVDAITIKSQCQMNPPSRLECSRLF